MGASKPPDIQAETETLLVPSFGERGSLSALSPAVNHMCYLWKSAQPRVGCIIADGLTHMYSAL
jgi:hypothetical protein